MAPRPLFFLVRTGDMPQTASDSIQEPQGHIVPLVALDELPVWLDIVGAPRELTVEQARSLSNLGTFPKPDGAYAVRILASTAAGDSIVEEEEVTIPRQAETAHPPLTGPVTTQSLAGIHPADAMRAYWAERSRAISSGLENSIHNQPELKAGTASAPPPPVLGVARTTGTTVSNTASLPSTITQARPTTTAHAPILLAPATQTAEYCRHWCHHGTCKWGAACRYFHSMPKTMEGLLSVGLHGFPMWWIASMLASGHNGPSNAGTAGDSRLENGVNAALGRLGTPTHPRLPLGSPHCSSQLLRQHVSLYGGHNNGSGISNKKLRAQLREAHSLLRGLGLVVPSIATQAQQPQPRKVREVSPLDKGKGVAVDAKSASAMAAPAKDEPKPSRDEAVLKQQQQQGSMVMTALTASTATGAANATTTTQRRGSAIVGLVTTRQPLPCGDAHLAHQNGHGVQSVYPDEGLKIKQMQSALVPVHGHQQQHTQGNIVAMLHPHVSAATAVRSSPPAEKLVDV